MTQYEKSILKKSLIPYLNHNFNDDMLNLFVDVVYTKKELLNDGDNNYDIDIIKYLVSIYYSLRLDDVSSILNLKQKKQHRIFFTDTLNNLIKRAILGNLESKLYYDGMIGAHYKVEELKKK